jgi:hypothetical protein
MTERAERAVAALQSLGWDCRDDSTKSCRKCDYPVERERRYCPRCGAEAPPYPAQEAVDDLEAAVAAALGDPWRWVTRGVGDCGAWNVFDTEHEARAETLRLCTILASEKPWRWLVRGVGDGGAWQDYETPEDAHECAARWTADGFACEIVPLFAGRAVPR